MFVLMLIFIFFQASGVGSQSVRLTCTFQLDVFICFLVISSLVFPYRLYSLHMVSYVQTKHGLTAATTTVY